MAMSPAWELLLRLLIYALWPVRCAAKFALTSFDIAFMLVTFQRSMSKAERPCRSSSDPRDPALHAACGMELTAAMLNG
uniref:Secreted protein n=1 Tax=Setaria viridis TaxID=4556 RepID=A0A4V6D1Q5_SETVI|nr:hypothetical protein SEVIR_9G373201v2 [Setaria viridis]